MNIARDVEGTGMLACQASKGSAGPEWMVDVLGGECFCIFGKEGIKSRFE